MASLDAEELTALGGWGGKLRGSEAVKLRVGEVGQQGKRETLKLRG